MVNKHFIFNKKKIIKIKKKKFTILDKLLKWINKLLIKWVSFSYKIKKMKI
jgi:hypothetical protein